LIIEAAPIDYQIIKNLLKQLDVMPRQVMIEVTFAEITLDESTAMGVEWSYIKGNENLSTSLLKATMGDSGLNFTVGNPDRWTAALSALATENKVNILSSPSIMASNSMPASIDISQEIPVASSQYQYTTGDNPLLETDIEYRDTGIMLSVTPNINEHGLVTMDIDQEISEQASNVSVGGQDYPSFFKRSTTTTLTVQSGQTIVIGGLIRETKSDGVSGTPWFNNIPVLDFLFGQTSDSTSKTELIILISPYVIETPDDVDAVTQEFTNKLSALHLHSE
jgi:general secretion pathway protein D